MKRLKAILFNKDLSKKTKNVGDAESNLNPFVVDNKVTPYERLKLVSLGMTVAPVRMAWLALMGASWFTFTQSAILFASKDIKNGKKPLSRRRRIVQRPGRWAARGLLFGFGYHRIKVRGRPSKDAKIIVSNHQSFLEHCWHFYKQGCCFLAKEEVGTMPFVGHIARALQTVFVRRDDADSRKMALESLIHRCNDPEWPQLLVYPEGTTTNGNCLARFHRGAFVPGLPVQPVVIKYPSKHMNPSWLPQGNLAKIGFRLVTQFRNRMEVEYLPVMSPMPNEDPMDFAKRVQEVMAKSLNVPATDMERPDLKSHKPLKEPLTASS